MILGSQKIYRSVLVSREHTPASCIKNISYRMNSNYRNVLHTGFLTLLEVFPQPERHSVAPHGYLAEISHLGRLITNARFQSEKTPMPCQVRLQDFYLKRNPCHVVSIQVILQDFYPKRSPRLGSSVQINLHAGSLHGIQKLYRE